MTNNIICAGIGGQGALTLGMILAEAAAMQGKNVTYVPEYGSQMRGGDACVKLKVSDEDIINPYMERVGLLVALHTQPLPQYLPMVEKDATIIAETDLAHELSVPDGIGIHYVPANKIAEEMGNPRGMNAVMAGAVVAFTDMFPFEDGMRAVASYYEHKRLPVEINTEAFAAGYRYMKDNV